jgi:phosphoadenosine phosphosulfate reductase
MTHISADALHELPLASAEDAGVALLRRAITRSYAGRLAVVSSFGAESAMLLALTAEIDPAVPVLFLDTGKHFPETLAYRDELVVRLGLTNVRSLGPDPVALQARDPHGDLHLYIPDDCCALRKVAPLEQALAPYAAWATGRRRQHASSRAAMHFVETVDGRVKLNPLADWTAERVTTELARRGLPLHPLVTRGFSSIGCAPCTRAVAPGEDPRAGRWAGRAKTECGIHAPAPITAAGIPGLSALS